jgi:hypothetical protein
MIQDKVLNQVASLIISNKIKYGDMALVDVVKPARLASESVAGVGELVVKVGKKSSIQGTTRLSKKK